MCVWGGGGGGGGGGGSYCTVFLLHAIIPYFLHGCFIFLHYMLFHCVYRACNFCMWPLNVLRSSIITCVTVNEHPYIDSE